MAIGHPLPGDAPPDGDPRKTPGPPRGLARLTAGMGKPFASFAHRGFRWLWFGMLGQASSTWTENVARSWLTLDMTHSRVAHVIVNRCRAVPLFFVGMWGEVAADRFDKRRLKS